MNSGNWVISLSTTSADWNSLSSTFANNIGGNNTVVFNGNLAQARAFGDTLSIIFSTPFTYNPANGNLLMDVFATGTSAVNGNIFFDTNGYNNDSLNGNTYLGRVFECGSGNVCVNNGYGLVTGFSTSAVTPEPGSIMLLGSGLLSLAGLLRRKMNSY
jgi:hypothetical protein